MNFKKILAGVLSVSLLGSSVMMSAIAQPANEIAMEESEVPLLAPKQQLIKQYKDFRRYLNRVNRCLFTGPCTKAEIMQVKRHGWKLFKLMVALGLIGGGLAYRRYRKPAEEVPAGETGFVERKIIEAKEMLARQTPEVAKEFFAGEAAFGAYPAEGIGPGGLIPGGVELKVRRKAKEVVPEGKKEETPARSSSAPPELEGKEEEVDPTPEPPMSFGF